MHKHAVNLTTLSVVIAALVLVVPQRPAAAQAQVWSLNTDIPLSYVLTPADSPCLAEDVTFDGTLHTVQQSVFNAAGGRSIRR